MQPAASIASKPAASRQKTQSLLALPNPPRESWAVDYASGDLLTCRDLHSGGLERISDYRFWIGDSLTWGFTLWGSTPKKSRQSQATKLESADPFCLGFISFSKCGETECPYAHCVGGPLLGHYCKCGCTTGESSGTGTSCTCMPSAGRVCICYNDDDD